MLVEYQLWRVLPSLHVRGGESLIPPDCPLESIWYVIITNSTQPGQEAHSLTRALPCPVTSLHGLTCGWGFVFQGPSRFPCLPRCPFQAEQILSPGTCCLESRSLLSLVVQNLVACMFSFSFFWRGTQLISQNLYALS